MAIQKKVARKLETAKAAVRNLKLMSPIPQEKDLRAGGAALFQYVPYAVELSITYYRVSDTIGRFEVYSARNGKTQIFTFITLEKYVQAFRDAKTYALKELELMKE